MYQFVRFRLFCPCWVCKKKEWHIPEFETSTQGNILPHIAHIKDDNHNKYFCRARRVDAPPRQSFSPNFQQQQQSFNLAGNLQQPLFGQTKKVATSNNNNFHDSRSEPLGGEITPNCVCRCTCCPCCPCTPGEEDYLQYID